MGLGHPCGENRVARLMRADGLRVKQKRRFRVTTQSAHQAPIAPNTLNRQFAVAAVAGINRVWVSDISVPQQAA